MELVRGNVKIELENIGEGWSGYYDETDKDDTPLLRFYVYKKIDDEWQEVDDASYCTALLSSISEEEQLKCLEILMNEFYEPVTDGYPVKKLGESLSCISSEWLKE